MNERSTFDRIWDKVLKHIEDSITAMPPTPPAPRKTSPRPAQDARARNEVLLNRILGETRRELHEERDGVQRSLLALNTAFERVRERWADVPGQNSFGEAYQGKTLTEAVNYAVYLIGLVQPDTAKLDDADAKLLAHLQQRDQALTEEWQKLTRRPLPNSSQGFSRRLRQFAVVVGLPWESGRKRKT